MRISDWSSDVCSSDLRLLKQEVEQQKILEGIQLSTSVITILQGDPSRLIRWEIRDANGNSMDGNGNIPLPENWTYEEDRIRFRNETYDGHSVRVAYIWGGRDMSGLRSEERRVGKECISPCTYR